MNGGPGTVYDPRLRRLPRVGDQPEEYDPKLDVDFTPLHEPDEAAARFGQAA
ncbi:hypothetical protein ABZO31_29445 [Streptomyces sp. HUAS MG47]|uniref:hypothetical protein n=1 Tax=Streptomyces solicamelliae TaxID=3231716 RepID=UPI003877B751